MVYKVQAIRFGVASHSSNFARKVALFTILMSYPCPLGVTCVVEPQWGRCDLVTFLFFCTIFRFSFMTLFLPFFYLRGKFKTRLCRSFESNLTFDSHPARHPDALPSSCLARAASHHPVDRTLLLLSLY